MTPPYLRLVLPAAALAIVACGGARTSPTAPSTAPVLIPGGVPAPPVATPTGEQGHEAAMARARADSVRRPYTAADVRFMQMMIGHHAQALVMSRMAPTHGASPEVRRLAARIVNGQQDEIATMQQWLRERRQQVPAVQAGGAADPHATHGSGHDAHGAHDMATMPGMLTPAQLRQLDAARNTEFDRLFLTLMIQHHKGAVAMVEELFATAGAAHDETVYKFADDVGVDQRTEIARMEQLLVAVVFGGP